MFRELVEPIQVQLEAANAELERLEAAHKAKKEDIRSLTKMLREASGEARTRKPRATQDAKPRATDTDRPKQQSRV